MAIVMFKPEGLAGIWQDLSHRRSQILRPAAMHLLTLFRR